MRHIESMTQCRCVRWFRLQYPAIGNLLFAVPNGGRRGKVEACILKAEGVVAGVADMLLLVPSGGWHGLAIEMKTETGRQSPSQREWQQLVEKVGYRYVVCRTIDEFINEVNKYLSNGKGENLSGVNQLNSLAQAQNIKAGRATIV